MTENLRLDDAALRSVCDWLITAAGTVLRAPARPDVKLESVSAIGGEVSAYLQDLDTACLALADAAQSAARRTAELMRNSGELDYRIAVRLGPGYAVAAS